MLAYLRRFSVLSMLVLAIAALSRSSAHGQAKAMSLRLGEPIVVTNAVQLADWMQAAAYETTGDTEEHVGSPLA